MKIKQITKVKHINQEGKDIDQITLTIGKGERAKKIDINLSESEDYLQEKEKSKTKPVNLKFLCSEWYLFKDKVLSVADSAGLSEEDLSTYVKHFVLRKEKEFGKIKKRIEIYEGISKLENSKRERISDSVKIFVWQRDEGKCAICGTKEKLEFDHIIPLSEGGGNTERNIQILCESCNRSKGKNI